MLFERSQLSARTVVRGSPRSFDQTSSALRSYRSLPSSPLRRARDWAIDPPQPSFQEEQKSVAALERWGHAELASETLEKVKFAEFTLTQRTEKNEVDKAILGWRSRRMVPRSPEKSDTAMKYAQEVSLKRLLKKEADDLTRERSIYARRYEDELTATVLSLESQLSSLTTTVQEYRSEASFHREKIVTAYEDLKSAKRNCSLGADSGEVGKAKTPRRDAAKAMKAMAFAKELESREKELAAKERIQALREMAEAVDVKIARLRRELSEVKSSEITHYLRLLSEGKDTRSDGLSWIIRKLWSSGASITFDLFPPYLDSAAVQTVIYLAQKTNEVEELREYLDTAKRSTVVSPRSKQRWNDIKSRLQVLASSPTQLKPAQNAAKCQVLDSQFADLAVIEQRISELSSHIERTKEAEIRRLTSECFINNYEKRFKTTLKGLVAAIVGRDAMDKYIAVINKEQKALAQELGRAKTFSFVPRA